MGELGNIYDAVETPAGARGADLRITVEVPREALGAGEPFFAAVPLILGGQRRADPHGDGGRVPLSLPENVPEGATLRLRGLGALGPGAGAEALKRAGDLYVSLKLSDAPWSSSGPRHGDAKAPWIPWAIGVGFLVILLGLYLALR